MKTPKEELLKIYSAYLPYDLNICTSYRASGFNNPKKMSGADIDRYFRSDSFIIKPILYSMDMLTKDELYNAGFEDHIDWLTNERENWIKKYGIEKFINKTPYGHIQYLISKHYNVFGLDESEFIKKESVIQK